MLCPLHTPVHTPLNRICFHYSYSPFFHHPHKSKATVILNVAIRKKCDKSFKLLSIT